jgi:ABC-2 type transport system permease protein
VYGASLWFTQKVISLEPFGPLLLRKMIDLVMSVFGGILLFSNVVGAFSAFLLADELRFLLVRPIPGERLYTARYLENAANASWMAVLFIVPVLVATGQAAGAGWGYYVSVPLVLAPMALLAAALAVPLVLGLTLVFPVQRTREVMLGLGVAAFLGLFLLVRSMNLQQLLRPQGFESTLELFRSLQTPGRYWLPTAWGAEVLGGLLVGKGWSAGLWLALGSLWSSAGSFYFVGAWSFGLTHRRAYSRAQHGQPLNDSSDSPLSAAAAARSARQLKAKLAALAKGGDAQLGPSGAIARKDALLFARDAVQWSQLLLLGSLVLVYLVNFRYMGAITQGAGVFGPIGMYFLNIALSGFMVTAISARLVFPAVSLEGKAFWLIKRSPLPMRRYLVAKWVGHTPPLLLLSQGLVLTSNVMIGSSWWLTLKSMAVLGVLVVAVAGLGVGLGAIFPRFHVDDAAKIATGVGGVLFMFLALSMTMVVIGLDAYPTYYLMVQAQWSGARLPAGFWWKAAGLWGLIAGGALGVAWGAVRVGAARLSR